MNILYINTFLKKGGAAIATFRLFLELKSSDLNIIFLHNKYRRSQGKEVKYKLSLILSVLNSYAEILFIKIFTPKQNQLFSIGYPFIGLSKLINNLEPNIVNLFWTANGFLCIEDLKKMRVPIVWTLHDMWPFTGGCHYDNGCGRYVVGCGNCPAIGSNKKYDLSRFTVWRKIRAWKNIPITVVATSNWIAREASKSQIFKDKNIVVIPNGVDTRLYKPIDKKFAREIFNFSSENKKLILFSAFNAGKDVRKGSEYLVQALNILSHSNLLFKNFELVILGAKELSVLNEVKYKINFIDGLEDEFSQSVLYSAVDILVAPSKQENLSNTVLEALSCGLPVVAFDIGGMPDMINHKENGYLATPFVSDSLAQGIDWILSDDKRYANLSHNARNVAVTDFDIKIIAQRYAELYKNINPVKDPSCQ
jgi:glycosyltransferase involved in cell wall biosynthesis